MVWPAVISSGFGRTGRRVPDNRKSWLAIAGTILVSLWLATTTGRAFESNYTSISEKHCRKFNVEKINGSEYAASRVCAGRGGYKVFIDEVDLRETLTVGRTMRQARKEPAARDSYGPFNGYDDRIEWRSGADGRPYALIVGWFFDDNDNIDATGRPSSARLLVVMRLPPGPVCRVANIDRAANSDANELARGAADEIARDFKCGTDSVRVIGKRGAAIEALARQAQ